MKNRIPRWVLVCLGILVVLLVAASIVIRSYSPLAKDWVIRALEERYDSKVAIGSFEASLLPPYAVARDVVLRQQGRTDIPPFVTLKTLTIEARLLGLLESPKRVKRVVLEGLQIHIPPHGGHALAEGSGKNTKKPERSPFVIGEIVAHGTLLAILPKDAGKEPKHFQIKQLTMHSVGIDRPMSFVTVLTNYKPPGEIHSTGQFGPWRKDEPGDTPVSGSYTFRDADLGVFKGIAGKLSSDGKYQGTLDRIDVNGTSDTPDFQVTKSGNPVHLKTDFHAIVDGTSGDTFLDPVKAQFLRSTVYARGGVYGKPGVKGKSVELNISVSGGRVEDMIQLGVSSEGSPIVGQITYQAKLAIPPGDRDVIDKMMLNGSFSIGTARFTNAEFESKLTKLSQVARGDPKGNASEKVYSDLKGQFDLRNSIIAFSRLSFGVPGALISIAGKYGIRSESLDFSGKAQLDAKPSEMTTGVKSVLLRAVDPFVHHDGLTTVPIKIGGTRSEPTFDVIFRFKRISKR